MAGNKNSGGANGGPQYSPMNVSATGGAGQSGQAKPNYRGFKYGENKKLAEQAGGARMATAQTPPPAPQVPVGQAPQGGNDMSSLQGLLSGITPINAEGTDPSIPVSHGVDFGRGAGSEVLPNSLNSDRRQIENVDLIKRYMPDLINASRVQGAPDSYKRFVNFLKSQVI
jgi:hypothetical protein